MDWTVVKHCFLQRDALRSGRYLPTFRVICIMRKVNESGTDIGRLTGGMGTLTRSLRARTTAKEPLALNGPFYKSRDVGSE